MYIYVHIYIYIYICTFISHPGATPKRHSHCSSRSHCRREHPREHAAAVGDGAGNAQSAAGEEAAGMIVDGKTMGNRCCLENLWQIYGKTMGKLWENYGKTPWDSGGSMVVSYHGKMIFYGDFMKFTLWQKKHSYGKPPSLMGKSTVNGPFSMAMLNYQRVSI